MSKRDFFPNVRFWLWDQGWIKITLRPGQKLEHCFGGLNEEGYSVTRRQWFYDPLEKVVLHYLCTEGRDCDGPHQFYSKSLCRLENLKARDMEKDFPDDPDNVGIFAPEWESVERSQRDYFAEAMGY